MLNVNELSIKRDLDMLFSRLSSSWPRFVGPRCALPQTPFDIEPSRSGGDNRHRGLSDSD